MEHMDSTMDLSKISEDIMFLDYVEDEAKGKGEGEAEGKGDNGGDHFVIEESSNSAQANKRTMMMVCEWMMYYVVLTGDSLDKCGHCWQQFQWLSSTYQARQNRTWTEAWKGHHWRSYKSKIQE